MPIGLLRSFIMNNRIWFHNWKLRMGLIKLKIFNILLQCQSLQFKYQERWERCTHQKGGQKMNPCPECLGKGEVFCTVCGGTRKDPGNTNHSCSNCGGVGYVRCSVCRGKGTLHHNDDQKAWDSDRGAENLGRWLLFVYAYNIIIVKITRIYFFHQRLVF